MIQLIQKWLKKKRNWFLCGTWHHLTLELSCCGFPSLARLEKMDTLNAGSEVEHGRRSLVTRCGGVFNSPHSYWKRWIWVSQNINPQTPWEPSVPGILCDRWVFLGFSDMFNARLPVISASWPMEMHGIRGFPWQTMQAEMMITTLRWIQDSKKLLFQLGASNFATPLWVLMLILVDIYSWALCFHQSM